MVSLLLTPRARTTSTMIAASAVLFLAAPTAVAETASVALPTSFAQLMPVLQQQGLDVQISGGVLGAEGPAALVKQASATLRLGGVGNTALYTGKDESGTGFVVVSGNRMPPTTDFQVMDMTAASVENNSTQLDAVYSDDGAELDALVAPETNTDITPVDIDYAAYPVGSTPPPDNHGLNPTSQFTYDGIRPLA